MAILANERDFTAPDIKIGPKTAIAAFYVVIAVIAMGVAIPAAIMSADAKLFEECYAAADVCNAN